MPIISRINEANSHFEYDENGVRAIVKYKDKNDKIHEKITYISTPCYIDEKIVSDDNNIYYKIRHFDDKREIGNYFTANEVLGSSKSRFPSAIDKLVQNGLLINAKCDNLFVEYFKTVVRQAPVRQGTSKTGWVNGEYFHAGFTTSKDIIYTGRSSVVFSQYGSKEKQFALWENIMIENPLVLWATGFQFSGCFSFHTDNGEVNTISAITGPSSMGKSGLFRAIQSSYTDPGSFASFNATTNSLEHTVHQHKDLFVLLDEVGQSKIRLEDRVAFIYDLANGRPKSRMFKINDTLTNKDEPQRYFSILLNGEESLLNGIKQSQGQQVRLIEIPLNKDIALWESITSQSEAESLQREIGENFGYILPEFITHLKTKLPTIEQEYKTLLDQLRKKVGSDSNTVNRKIKPVARGFLAARYLLEILIKDHSKIQGILDNCLNSISSVLFSTINDIDDTKDKYRDLLAHIQDTHQQYFLTGDDNDNNKRVIFGDIKYNNTDKKKIVRIYNTQFDEFVRHSRIAGNLFIQYLKDNGFLKMDASKRSTYSRDGKRYYWIEVPTVFTNDQEPPMEQAVLDIPPDNKFEDDRPVDPFAA